MNALNASLWLDAMERPDPPDDAAPEPIFCRHCGAELDPEPAAYGSYEDMFTDVVWFAWDCTVCGQETKVIE